MSMIDKYPSIRNAALLIAYDNSMINRWTTETEWLANLDNVLGAEGVTADDLKKLDGWLLSLSVEEMETLCMGDQDEAQLLVDQAPRGGPDNVPLTGILTDIFES